MAQQLAREVFGDSWHPNEQLVRMRTLPPPMPMGSTESRASLARYEARNPNWREGWGIVFIMPITASNLFGAAALGLRRIGKPATRVA